VVSCTDDNDPIENLDKEIEDLIKIKTISNDDHNIEIFSIKADFYNGYNLLTLRVFDKVTEEYITNASISWMPVMNMMNKTHSCPKSDINKISGKKSVYEGFIVFQMPGNDNEGWELTLNYSINGTDYTAKGDIAVMKSDKQVVSVFTGADNVRYILALIEPFEPEVKVNDMSAGLYKMKDMMNLPSS